MKGALASVRDSVRTQLWPLPALGVVLATAAGVLLPRVDSRLGQRVPSGLSGVLFGGDAAAARTLLDSIASSLITVTSLTFSLTVVTLQLASSQFSPRLLRTFTRDFFVQATLALFLSTFTYSLTVLRAVRSEDDGGVPRISVTLAFVLGISSVLGLVLFLAHLARQLRVESMLREVHQDASATVRVATRARDGSESPPAVPTPPKQALALTAPSSGFLTSIDHEGLCSAAAKANAQLVIDCYPGSSVVEDVPIGQAWGQPDLDDDAAELLQAAIRKSIKIGYERTAAQDVGYGLRQLTDVANKALSPGINDPTTAIHALGHISALLCQLAGRDLSPILLTDDDRIRVVLHRPDLADLVEGAIVQPRRYGSSDPQVLLRLFQLLEELAYHVDDATLVRSQRDRLITTVAQSDFDDAEVAQLQRAAQRVDDALKRGTA